MNSESSAHHSDIINGSLVVEQQPGAVHVVSLGGHMQGAQAVLGLGGHGGPTFQQEIHHLFVATPSTAVQRSQAILEEAEVSWY